MTKLYVTGGQQQNARSLTEGETFWYKYAKGLILEVDSDSQEVHTRAEYVSPPDVCPDEDPAILFKCGSLEGDRLYVGTQTEVLVYSVPDMSLSTYISLPCFNDVHHVRPSLEGNLLVANSGLDMVLEITTDGEVLREWNTLGEDPWARFSPEVDYRQVRSLKPHASHPNHVFYVGDELWATRFEQRDAICLSDPSKRIDVGIERVHDGHVYDGHIYFTSVNGHVVIANADTLVVVQTIDLNLLAPEPGVLGWCRGLLVDGDRIWVGFSRIRMTKVRENLSWIRQGFRRLLPTRISCYHLSDLWCEQEINLQDHGLDAVFSIFSATTAASQSIQSSQSICTAPDD